MTAKKTPAPVVTDTLTTAFTKTHQALTRALFSNKKALQHADEMVEAATAYGFSDTVRGVKVTFDNADYTITSRV